MGRVTQFLDYLSRPSELLTADFIKGNYTHIDITEETKKLRGELKWYKEAEYTQQELF